MVSWRCWLIRPFHALTPHIETGKGRHMELLLIVIAAIILYLWTDNRKVAEQMQDEPNPALKAQKGCAIGIGWYIIILLGAFLLLGSAVGFDNLNVGMEDGSFTLTQPHDQNNPIARPIGEILGVTP